MGRSKETSSKKDKEKQRLKHRQEKHEKMQERKANATKKSLDDMMAYLDENGNITNVPPDPRKKKIFNSEDIQIGVPKQEDIPYEPRTGTVSFFDDAKGFGFIIDKKNGERVFVHVNNLSEPLKASDQVQFDVEMGPRGASAINVSKIS
jgi:cold shock CspA family protein